MSILVLRGDHSISVCAKWPCLSCSGQGCETAEMPVAMDPRLKQGRVGIPSPGADRMHWGVVMLRQERAARAGQSGQASRSPVGMLLFLRCKLHNS